MAGVHVIIDHVALQRLLKSPFGPVGRDAVRRGRRVRNVAQRLAPKRSGRLASSINVNVKIRLSGLVVEVGSDLSYARFVHDGTGIYGPRHRPITGGRGGVMVFRGSTGEVVYARSVAGMPGTPYLARAVFAAV